MNTIVMNQPAPSLADAARNLLQAGVATVRRGIATVSAKTPDIRPTECTIEAMPEYLEILDTVMKVPGTDREEPVALITFIVEQNGQKFRLYYRNPFSFLKRDLPRMRGYYECGGLAAIIAKPELLKTLVATIDIEYAGDKRQFTNVRVTGSAAYSPSQKDKLSALAKLMGEDVAAPTTTQVTRDVPLAPASTVVRNVLPQD